MSCQQTKRPRDSGSVARLSCSLPPDPQRTSDDLSAQAGKTPLFKARHSAICLLPPPPPPPAASESLSRPSLSAISHHALYTYSNVYLYITFSPGALTFCCLPDVSPQSLKNDPPHPPTPPPHTHAHIHSQHSYMVSSGRKKKDTHLHTFPDLSAKEHSMLSHSKSRLLFFTSVRVWRGTWRWSQLYATL